MANPARIKLGLIAILCLALATVSLLVANPKVLDKNTIRNTLIEQLSAWAGAKASINGPVNIQYFPRLMVEMDDVRMPGIRHLPTIGKIISRQMRVRLGLSSLFSSEPVIDRITFVEPLIETRAQSAAPDTNAQQDLGASFKEAMASTPVNQIVIEQGTIKVAGAKAPETISSITAKINIDPGGTHNLRGSLNWREQQLTFSYEGGTVEKLTNSSRIPVSLTLSGDLVSAEINGQAMISNDIRMNGNMDLRIPELPKFARWTGVLVPEDQKLRDFSANGSFHWTGHRIGFDEGSFTLDGNRALGALALDFVGLRPKIDGTLALQRLDLTQYFEPEKPAESDPAKTGSSKDKTVELDFPLLHHINFDLRISTTDLVAEPLRLGQTALSVSLDAGKLAADIAIFELCGGSGTSRIELDATVPNSEIRLTASLSGISARTCIEIFSPKSPLDGATDITADLTSSGRTVSELLQMLRGKATLTVVAGNVALNFDNLITQLREQPVTGWKIVTGESTAFKLLKGDIFLRPNAIYTDSFTMDLGSRKFVAEGTVDFAEQTMDIQMEQSEQSPEADGKEKLQTPPARKEHFVIKGPWSHPSFNLGQRKSSAHGGLSRATVRTATWQAN